MTLGVSSPLPKFSAKAGMAPPTAWPVQKAAPPQPGDASKPVPLGVGHGGSSYKTATPPNPYSLWSGRSGSASGAQAAQGSLAVNARAGQVKPEDLKGKDPGANAQTLEKLANGNAAQISNFLKLMNDPKSSETLGKALDRMTPDARERVLQLVGNASAWNPQDKTKLTESLGRAMDKMQPAQRDNLLRDTYLKGDKSAALATNGVLASRPEQAKDLLVDLGSRLQGPELAKALNRLDGPAMRAVIKGIAQPDVPVEDTQVLFRKLGAAVSGPPVDRRLQDKIGTAVVAQPMWGGVLLGRVARDSRDLVTMEDANSGRQLAKDILSNMEPKQLDSYMNQIRGLKGNEKVDELLLRGKRSD